MGTKASARRELPDARCKRSFYRRAKKHKLKVSDMFQVAHYLCAHEFWCYLRLLFPPSLPRTSSSKLLGKLLQENWMKILTVFFTIFPKKLCLYFKWVSPITCVVQMARVIIHIHETFSSISIFYCVVHKHFPCGESKNEDKKLSRSCENALTLIAVAAFPKQKKFKNREMHSWLIGSIGACFFWVNDTHDGPRMMKILQPIIKLN